MKTVLKFRTVTASCTIEEMNKEALQKGFKVVEFATVLPPNAKGRWAQVVWGEEINPKATITPTD